MQRPGAREGEALLLAAGEHARRPVREMAQADLVERGEGLRLALHHRDAGNGERIDHVRQRRAAQHHRALEHHRLVAAQARQISLAPAHAARSRLEQAMHQAHQHALAGAVRAQDDRARPGLDRE